MKGLVVGHDVLRGIVTVRTGDGKQQRIPVAELRRASKPNSGCANGPHAGHCARKKE
jgi:hypothetical protein